MAAYAEAAGVVEDDGKRLMVDEAEWEWISELSFIGRFGNVQDR